MTIFSFGSDPEFIIQKDDDVKSAIGILPSKENALEKNGSKIYYDNVLAELAVKPSFTKQEAIDNTYKGLRFLADAIYPHKLVMKSAANYPIEEINCDEARIVGCNPEWDVYSLEMISPPSELTTFDDGYYRFINSFRTAGGHIHAGSDSLLDQYKTLSFVRMMDLFVGTSSIFLDKDATAIDRRKFYGKAGSHRLPLYGVEYRPLGNFWCSTPELVGLIYDLTEFVINFIDARLDEKFWSKDENFSDMDDTAQSFQCFGYDVEMLKSLINSCNKADASKFMLFISNYLPDSLVSDIESLSMMDAVDPYEGWGI